MNIVRRFSFIAFAVACAHLAFGAIVRISGSGMGCGPYWPKCHDQWFPPLDKPDVVIEWSHRGLASILLLALIALAIVSWQRRAVAGVGGRGGVLRSALLAVALGFSAAILGAVTVKLGNAPFATLAHWTVAMSLVATVVTCVIRAGGLGGTTARSGGASAKTSRAAFAGAAVALVTVVMGGLTAKYPGAAVACRSFPLCGTNPDVLPGAVHIQLTHRVLAVLLVLHLFGLVMALRKRKEIPLIRRAAAVALSLGVLQLLVAGAMIGMHLPPVLRSLHEATGVSVWIATFVLAYLARIASGGSALGKPSAIPPTPDDTLRSGSIRASKAAKHAYAGAVAERGAVEAKEPWQSEARRSYQSGATDAYLGAFAVVHHEERPEPVLLGIATASAGASVAAAAQDDIVLEEAVLLSVATESAVPPVAALTQGDIIAEAVVLSEANDMHIAEVEETERAGPSVAVLAQGDIVAEAVVPSEAKDMHLNNAEELEIVGIALEEIAIPTEAALLTPVRRKSTMHHSVAVIIARGADF